MQEIIAPISREEPRDNRRAIIDNLQTALRILLRARVIPAEPQEQQQLEDSLRREQRDGVYGDITQRLVTIFQQQFPRRPEVFQQFFLVASGNVDAPTAAVMNQRLIDLGELRPNQEPDGRSFTLRGQVVNANGPVNDINVDVFDRDLFFRRDGENGNQRLNAEALVTRNLPPKNEDGCFELNYTTAGFSTGDLSKDGVTIPDLIFALSKGEQQIEKFQIFRLPDGQVLAEEVLVSDDDLIMGIQARRVEEVRIVIGGVEQKPETSEYERVIRAIAQLLPGQIPEDEAQHEAIVRAAVERFDEEKHRDISFVARETGFDSSLIQALIAAFRLAADPFQNQLRPHLFYGLARRRAVYDLPALARLSTDDMRLAFTEATTGPSPLIPAFASDDELKRTVAIIRDILTTQLLNHRADDAAPSLSDLLGNDLPNVEDQATLWRTFSDHEGTATEFWEKLKSEPGFDDSEKIAKLQYSFQLGLLAQDNLSLINEVRTKHPEVVDTKQLAFALDTQEKWEALLTDEVRIPDDVPGKPEERKAIYAASLAVAVQIAQPTVAVANMVAALPATHLAGKQAAVAKFLAAAVQEADFDLVSGSVDELLSKHSESLLAAVDVKERPTVIDQVKRLQRLFRLSTDPKSMQVLLDAGFNSAREIASLPPEVVLEMLTPELDEPTARLIINRATNISAAAVHQFVLLNDAVNGEVPGGAL